MVASVVQSASAHTSTTPSTVTLGATPTVGNTLIAIMASDTTHTGVPTAGTGLNYTQRISQVASQGFYVWSRLVVSGDSAATTFTPNGANPAALAVVEVQGTFDKIGTGTTNTSTAAASRTTNSLTPATTDGLTVAIAGLHSVGVGGSALTGGSVDNTFTFLTSRFSTITGATQCGVVLGSKVTSSTAATGITTLAWTGNADDRDGVQIAFTGVGGAAAVSVPRRIGKRQW